MMSRCCSVVTGVQFTCLGYDPGAYVTFTPFTLVFNINPGSYYVFALLDTGSNAYINGAVVFSASSSVGDIQAALRSLLNSVEDSSSVVVSAGGAANTYIVQTMVNPNGAMPLFYRQTNSQGSVLTTGGVSSPLSLLSGQTVDEVSVRTLFLVYNDWQGSGSRPSTSMSSCQSMCAAR